MKNRLLIISLLLLLTACGQKGSLQRPIDVAAQRESPPPASIETTTETTETTETEVNSAQPADDDEPLTDDTQ